MRNAYTANPLLNPPGGLFISNTFGVGESLFNLGKMVELVLHREAECKVEKLNYMKQALTQPRKKNRSEIPSRE